ncbi:MAG TPA: AraC family transcriptional regulator [Pyrinomonadaceae bacterium]
MKLSGNAQNFDESNKPSRLPPNGALSDIRPSLESIREKLTYSRRLERLWIFIEEHYSEPDTHLDDAARYCGISRDHLNSLLNQFADITFYDFLIRYRIEKCLELLHRKNYTLTEIYSRCGFNGPGPFIRQFKKWVGCLPSDYKKQYVRHLKGKH